MYIKYYLRTVKGNRACRARPFPWQFIYRTCSANTHLLGNISHVYKTAGSILDMLDVFWIMVVLINRQQKWFIFFVWLIELSSRWHGDGCGWRSSIMKFIKSSIMKAGNGVNKHILLYQYMNVHMLIWFLSRRAWKGTVPFSLSFLSSILVLHAQW